MARWLRGDLSERARLAPESLRLRYRLNRPAQAVLTLPPGDAPEAGDWMELYDQGGSAGVWRVRRREERPGEDPGVTLELEHGLALLADTVLPRGFAAAGEAGTDLARALAMQPAGDLRWTPGNCDLAGLWERDLSLRTALEALRQILEDGGGVCRTDQSRLPWVLHAERPEETLCRCAEGRNLLRAAVTRDSSALCTRLYAEGAPGVTLPGYLDSDRTGLYGVRCGVWIDRSLTGTNALLAAARRELARRDRPRVTAVAEAIDLYPETGEEADRFALGRPCRLAWEGGSLTERIVGIERPDAVGEPERVVLTLGQPSDTPAAALTEMERRVGALERG